MSEKKVRFLPILFSVCFLSGCATNYIDKSKQGSSTQNPLTDAVLFEVNPDLVNYEPRCINVLPFNDERASDKDADFRKAFHAQLSVTGIRLVPLQAKVENSAAFAGCDLELRGKVVENRKLFLGVYSEYRAGAEVELIETKSQKYFWRASHTLVKRSGGVPLGIFSAIAGTASAAVNLEPAQAGRITFELADRIVKSIPNLAYRGTDEPKIVAAPVRPAELPANDSVYQYLANVDRLDKVEQIPNLEKYFLSLDQKNDYSRRLVAEKLLKLEPESTVANRWMLQHQFEQGNNSQAVELATKLIKSNPSDKELFSFRARGFSNLGDKESAVKDFIKAIALGDESEETLNRLGGIYGALGRFDLAITVYDRLLVKNPSNFNALLLSGVAQAADGNQEKAYEMLRRALVASLSKDNLEQAKRARNALQSTGTYDMLSDVDKQFMASKFK